MPGISHGSKHKKPKDDGNRDENHSVTDKSSFSALSQVIRGRMIPIPKGPPRDEESKQQFFVNLVRLREERFTIPECALELGVSERTISSYMQEPLYKETQEMMVSEAKQVGHLLISEVIPMAVEGLVELASNASISPFVRYKCYAELLNYAGFNEPKESAHIDSRTEVTHFLKEVEQKRRNTTVNIQNLNINSGEEKKGEESTVVESVPPELAAYSIPVEAGGKLPAVFRQPRQSSESCDIIRGD